MAGLPSTKTCAERDGSYPYNTFDFTLSRSRDVPQQFLKSFKGTLLADGYGGYDGRVVAGDLVRAGCMAHARRKFLEAEKSAQRSRVNPAWRIRRVGLPSS